MADHDRLWLAEKRANRKHLKMQPLHKEGGFGFGRIIIDMRLKPKPLDASSQLVLVPG
jgi:hypothetical protein